MIALHGGPEDIKLCLDSLRVIQDLFKEVIVVDNASRDGADKVAEGYEFVKMIRNDTNRGFGPASNQGFQSTTAEMVVFLNSDTFVTRAGLIRLIEALLKSGSIGAAGACTNQCFGAQLVPVTYTSTDTIELFAEDFAFRDKEDEETDMLVGFCMAVRRSVFEEIGLFDERFTLGTFEDNDGCYRIRKAGYRLVIASKSFIHHSGSKTMERIGIHPVALLRQNRAKFVEKWKEDIESGFASHLSGLAPERIKFDPDRSPEARARQAAPFRDRADMSLVMIARDEERCIGDCLRSAVPFFTQIVVVDTGSTDRTPEIARELGAEVYDHPWEDSFSVARNHSMSYARGRSLFWCDADDVIPWETGMALLDLALNAPPNIKGGIVPVQFPSDGPRAGTRVDHLKWFVRLPGIESGWEGRIHEQIVDSWRRCGGTELARLGTPVLHLNYDFSPDGQAKKAKRDDYLLRLDYQDRPTHPFPRFNLGMTYHHRGAHRKAVSWLRRCLTVSQPGDSIVRKTYAMLGISLRHLDRKDESYAALRHGLDLVGPDPELSFELGLHHLLDGDHAEAKRYFLAIEPAPAGAFTSFDISILGVRRLFNLGAAAHMAGNYLEAKDWWLKAAAEEVGTVNAHLALFDAALTVGDHAAARTVHESVRQREGAGKVWTAMGIRYSEHVGGPANAEAFLMQAARDFPNEAEPLLALAKIFMQSGREAEGLRHLQALERFGCDEAAYILGTVEIRAGHLREALRHTEIALQLSPGNPEVLAQLKGLKEAIDAGA